LSSVTLGKERDSGSAPYAFSVIRMYTFVYDSCLPFRNTYVFRRKHPISYVCFGYILAT
jgi:hypothetical protein